jgi:hypothetical protein
MIVRIIEYQIPGFRPAWLLTTILDPQISAKELVLHYPKCWDIEIAFDEIKTHQCATLPANTHFLNRLWHSTLDYKGCALIFDLGTDGRDVLGFL